MTLRIKVCRWSNRVDVGAFIRRPFVALVALAITAVAVAGCSGQASASASSAPISPPANAAALERDYVQVVQAMQPLVVQITTDQGLGSGIVFQSVRRNQLGQIAIG